MIGMKQLQENVIAYRELDRLSDAAMKAATEQHTIPEDIPALIDKQLSLIQQLDRKLPENLTQFEKDPASSALLHERFLLMKQILKKSRDNAANLDAKKRIIGSEVTNIRRGRGSIPAYKETVETSGRIIQNRY